MSILKSYIMTFRSYRRSDEQCRRSWILTMEGSICDWIHKAVVLMSEPVQVFSSQKNAELISLLKCLIY